MNIFESLKYCLSGMAYDFFENLLKPEKVYCGKSDVRTLVAGDCDGSIGRMILLAMHSNHVDLDEIGISKLVLILEYEALIMASSYPKIHIYQTNHGISALLTDLVDKHLTYHASENRLIFIGDILHDRLSCNKTAAVNLIVHLYEVGVIFILGNHDVYRESYTSEGKCLGEGGQFGEYAIDQGNKTWDEWQEFEKKYFVHCYYDNERNCFFIHNGIMYEAANEGCRIWLSYDGVKEVYRDFDIAIFGDRENNFPASLWFKDERGNSKEFNLNNWPELKELVDCYAQFKTHTWRDKEKLKLFLDENKESARARGLYIRSFGYYQTAFGDIEANNIEELCDKINRMDYVPRQGWFTDFRPKDDSMNTENGLFSEKKITIIHGHHGFFCTDDESMVININARVSNKFSTSAVFLIGANKWVSD